MNTHHNEDEQPLSQDELSDSQMIMQNYNNDDRLHYTLLTLGLEELVNLFMDNNITFVDLLLLCKEDLIDLRLPLYQRNRIFNFAQMFNKYAKNYTINEITDFFVFHKQFIFNSTLVERITTNQNVITQNNNNTYQLTGSFNVNSGDNNNENELRYDNDNDGANEHKGNNVHIHSYSKQNKHKMTLSTSKEILKDDDNNINNNNNIAHVYHNDIHTQQKPNKHKSKTTSNINNNNNKDINTNTNTPEYAAYISNKNVKNKLNTNIAYKKYIETKKEADQVLEQLTKLKEDQYTKHNKYNSLMKRTTKGKYNYTSNTNGIDYNTNNNNNYDMNYYNNNNNNEMNYEDANEQGYEGEEENELQNEYDKMASKIEEIEKMKMDYNTFMLLNKIKNQVINKGDNITFEDINAVNEKLIALEEVINKKEMLRQNLQNKKESIEKTKNLLNNIDNGCNNNMNVNYNEYNCQGDVNDVNEVEEVQEEYEQESEDQINYKENSM